MLFAGADELTAAEGEQMAGQVGGGGQLGRDLHLVTIVKGHQSLVESPVAERAEGQAVARIVVVAVAPGDDVGGGHGGMAVGGEDAHAAQGAAVVVGFDDGAAEALVAHRFGGAGFTDDLLLRARLGQQLFAVVEGGHVDCGLLEQGRLHLRGEVGGDEGIAQGGTAVFRLQSLVQILVQLSAQGKPLQRGQTGVGPVNRQRRFLTGAGQEPPEALTLQVIKGIGQVPALAGRAHGVPVTAEQVTQFRRQLNEVGAEAALSAEVQHGQEQQGFVGGAEGGNGRPPLAVFVRVQVGELVEGVVEGGHAICGTGDDKTLCFYGKLHFRCFLYGLGGA
jgi:hypothetical protein